MHEEGLQTYIDSIKIIVLLLCISNRQDKEIEITIIFHVCHHACITTYTTLFLAVVLTNELYSA